MRAGCALLPCRKSPVAAKAPTGASGAQRPPLPPFSGFPVHLCMHPFTKLCKQELQGGRQPGRRCLVSPCAPKGAGAGWGGVGSEYGRRLLGQQGMSRGQRGMSKGTASCCVAYPGTGHAAKRSSIVAVCLNTGASCSGTALGKPASSSALGGQEKPSKPARRRRTGAGAWRGGTEALLCVCNSSTVSDLVLLTCRSARPACCGHSTAPQTPAGKPASSGLTREHGGHVPADRAAAAAVAAHAVCQHHKPRPRVLAQAPG